MKVLLPPEDGLCPVCGVDHDPNLPHDYESLYYQQRFLAIRGRPPHWADAMAHCVMEVQRLWAFQLKKMGVWVEPSNEPIADPPAESLRQIVQYVEESA